MCSYCNENNTSKDAEGEDCIVYNEKENQYYLVAEHCRNEVVWIEVNYCSKCGRKLG